MNNMNYIILDEEGFPTRPCSDPDSDYMCKHLQYDNLFYEPYCNNNRVCQERNSQNAEKNEWDKAIDAVLEIIDKRIIIQEMKHAEANDILHEITAEIRATEVKEIRNEIVALKGGEQ